jgi:hypothetical protein
MVMNELRENKKTRPLDHPCSFFIPYLIRFRDPKEKTVPPLNSLENLDPQIPSPSWFDTYRFESLCGPLSQKKNKIKGGKV